MLLIVTGSTVDILSVLGAMQGTHVRVIIDSMRITVVSVRGGLFLRDNFNLMRVVITTRIRSFWSPLSLHSSFPSRSVTRPT